jgi:hypothetical protein
VRKEGQEDEVEIIKPDAGFGTTPTLFQKSATRRPMQIERDAQTLKQDKPPTNQRQQAERK